MSTAFEITEEDVRNVLNAHGVEFSEDYVDMVFLECPRIEQATLFYDVMEEQTHSALDEIETVLIENKVLTKKLFRAP